MINHTADRLIILYNCLYYSKYHTQKLKLGDRICINQEIAQLLNQLNFPQSKAAPVPELIELKIQSIKHLINQSNYMIITDLPYLNNQKKI